MLLNDVSIQKIPKFGQKFNKLKEMTAFLNDIDSVAAISKAFSENELQDKLGKDLGTWIYKASQGIDETPVKAKGTNIPFLLCL